MKPAAKTNFGIDRVAFENLGPPNFHPSFVLIKGRMAQRDSGEGSYGTSAPPQSQGRRTEALMARAALRFL